MTLSGGIDVSIRANAEQVQRRFHLLRVNQFPYAFARAVTRLTFEGRGFQGFAVGPREEDK